MPAFTASQNWFLDGGETLAAVDQSAILINQPTTEPAIGVYIDGDLTDRFVTSSPAIRDSASGYAAILIGGYPSHALGAAGPIHIGETGNLTVTNAVPEGLTRVFYVGSWGPDFVNNGTVQVSAQGEAVGVSTWDPATQISNSHVFRVTAQAPASGFLTHNGAVFTNSGLIEVIGHGAVHQQTYREGGYEQVATAVQLRGFESSFLNTGTIRIEDNDPAHDSVAVVWDSTMLHGAFDNRGEITGDVALRVAAYSPDGPQIFHNEGVLNGRVEFGPPSGISGRPPAAMVLVNSGQIHGTVGFDQTDDSYDGRGGALTGALDGGGGADTLTGGDDGETLGGGAGNDLITGGAGANYLMGGDGDDQILGGAAFDRENGNVGNDTVHGGGGDDWVTGGQSSDVLYGDDGADILNGNLGNDSGDGGAGADTVRGGQGDDVLGGGDGDDYLTGDLGDDTMSGGAGADRFRAFAGGGHDVIADFNASEGDRIVLDPGTSYTATQQGADVLVDLGGGAQTLLKNVQLAGLAAGWIA